MKTVAAAALLGLVAAATTACGGDDQPPPVAPVPTATAPTPPPVDTTPVDAAPPPPQLSMLDMQVALQKAMVASVGDADKNAALYATDATMMIPGQPLQDGREEIRAARKQLLEWVPNLATAASRMWCKGNTMAIEWVATGTDAGTQKPFGLSGFDVVTVRDDGLIATHHRYYNEVTLLAQVGKYKGTSKGWKAPAILSLPTAAVEMHVAKNDATEAANVATMRAQNAAWFASDLKTMDATVADDVVSIDMSGDGTHMDKKALDASQVQLRKYATIDAYNDTLTLGVEDFTIDENVPTVTPKAAGIAMAKVKLEHPKQSTTLHTAEVDQWKDGKTFRIWQWSNDLEPQRQLGFGAGATPKPSNAAKPKKPSKPVFRH